MTVKRQMTLEDWAITAMSVGVCIFIGLIVTSAVALLFNGFWILLLIALPLLLLQFLVEGAMHGLWYGARRLLGYKPQDPPPDPEPDLTVPWLRINSGWIGFAIGVVAALLFGDLWGTSA